MQAFLRDEYARISYTTTVDDGKYPLQCLFRESGIMGASREADFHHRKPDHNRIFIMLSGEATVEMNSRRLTLTAGYAYLLPVYQTFKVKYLPDCRFLYFHFNVHAVTGLDVFGGVTAVQRMSGGRWALREMVANYSRVSRREPAGGSTTTTFANSEPSLLWMVMACTGSVEPSCAACAIPTARNHQPNV